MITHFAADTGPTWVVWYVNEFFSYRGYLLEIVHEEASHVNHVDLPKHWACT